MKDVKNKRKLMLLSFILSLVFAFKGYAEDLQAPASKHVKNKAEKEILVAKDIGGGLIFSLNGWCGNTSFLIHGTETGIELMDFNGNKTTVTSKSTDYPLGCTPDGKWVIYKDRNSAREYRDRFGRVPDNENIVDDGPGLGATTDAFAAFAKGDASAGSGLGLDIVRRLCAAAAIGLCSGAGRDGRGACFTLNFRER